MLIVFAAGVVNGSFTLPVNLGGAFTKQAADDCAGIWQA
jgi:hypothetical protein